MEERIIKFRAWDKKEKKMYDWETDFGIANDTDGLATVIERLEGEYILMQYTGLKDKDRIPKEIYEGDVLQGNDVRKVVKWDRIQAGFNINYLEIDVNRLKIIGNIYQNKELLK